jgi:hypothetical protein
MREELPELQGKGFESTGRYGIGFFSVFMWGGRVRVTTRKYRCGMKDTLVIEFKGGLERRPLLRSAQEDECLDEGGTRVRVWMNHPPESLFSSHRWRSTEKSWTFEETCIWLCPALDVSLYVEDSSGRARKIIHASDWKTMPAEALCRRIWVDYNDNVNDNVNDAMWFHKQLKAAEHYGLLKDSQGEVVGRASLTPHVFGVRESSGVVTVGGFRTSDVNLVAGILVGSPRRAARDVAVPVAPEEELRRWATEQAVLGTSVYSDLESLLELAACVTSCGGDTGDLPIAAYGPERLTFSQIAKKKDWPDQIVLSTLPYAYPDYAPPSGVLGVPGRSFIPWVRELRRLDEGLWPPRSLYQAFVERPWSMRGADILAKAVIEGLANAWGLRLMKL